MFFESDQINSSDSGANGMVFKVFQIVLKELDAFNQGNYTEQPQITYYRLRNLIYSGTSILNFFLCFQQPFGDKSSASQIYSSNSQQSPHKEFSQKS
jgi:hypothetical protein